MNFLKNYPAGSVPVALATMKKYLGDFIKKRDEMKSSWKQDCIKHWAKSLDHKSFYFKQNDKKLQVPKEYVNQMRIKMDERNKPMSPESQKEENEFFSGLKAEIEMKFKISPNIDPSHPMLLADPIYSERFETLPQYRFLINDSETLKLTIKYLYVHVDNLSGQSQRQKDFLISFAKYFLNIGFVKKDLENLGPVELPEDIPELIKNNQEFYQKYESGELPDEAMFSCFFSNSEQEDAIVNIGTNRKDFLKETIPLRSSSKDEILESDPGDSEEDEEEESKQSNKYESYINYDEEDDLSERAKTARFLPLFTDDQTLFFGTKHFYIILRQFHTLYERFLLVKTEVREKLRKDIKTIKEEHKGDTTKLEENFEEIATIRYK